MEQGRRRPPDGRVLLDRRPCQHVAETFAPPASAPPRRGQDDAQERRETLAAYDRGEIQVITNVAVLTEGWDCQPTSCVILLRPSSFKSTMIQMIGRGLRKVEPERYPGVIKDDCIVLDFGTSILTHGSIEQDVDLDQARA
jgi:DNA repair protein RadD